MDGMRVESVVRGFAANAAELLPLQRQARTLLPPLLLYMTCELLGVRLPAPEVRRRSPNGALLPRRGRKGYLSPFPLMLLILEENTFQKPYMLQNAKGVTFFASFIKFSSRESVGCCLPLTRLSYFHHLRTPLTLTQRTL